MLMQITPRYQWIYQVLGQWHPFFFFEYVQDTDINDISKEEKIL